jgi:FKBP-type peptidyl-prolyl cis-trans isomerase
VAKPARLKSFKMAAMACIRHLCKSGLITLVGLISACGGKSSTVMPAGGVSSMQSIVLRAGTGEAITAGKIAVVQYTGWLYEASAKDNKGKQFDSSRTGGQPFRFPVGTGQVIKGWDQGVIGMKVGESRRLIIPADLAYGDSGAGGVIPPGATLVFDIDLVAIE